MKKTVILIVIAIALVMSLALPAFANAPSLTVKLRVEGKDENLFYGDITTNNSLNYNILSILMLADNQSDKMNIEGLAYGYVTAINGAKIGEGESGLATYSLRVNGEYVPFSEAATYPLENGDEILLYYGDEFGKGFMFPIVDTKKLHQGYIKFTCEMPAEDGEGVTTQNIIGATVTWYCDEVPFTYVTDAQGGIYVEKNALTGGAHKVSLELKDENGIPMLLRLTPDYKIDVPVEIGDSFAVYLLAAVSALSLVAAAVLFVSLKKKRI